MTNGTALIRGLAAMAAALALAGCAALPSRFERHDSQAIGGATTSLGRIAVASAPAEAHDLSGFRLLPEGEQALEARLALIQRAEKSVDVQYYLIANDRTGRQFLAALEAAAGRGVRVRVLVDDLYAVREDALFAALAGAARLRGPALQSAAGARRRLRQRGSCCRGTTSRASTAACTTSS